MIHRTIVLCRSNKTIHWIFTNEIFDEEENDLTYLLVTGTVALGLTMVVTVVVVILSRRLHSFATSDLNSENDGGVY